MYTQQQRTIQEVLVQEEYLSIALDLFLNTKKAENLASGTLTFYRQKLGAFLAFCDGQEIKSVRQLSPDALRGFLTRLREHGHDDGGIHAHYRTVKTFLKWFEREYEPDDWKNPIAKVKAPRVAIEPLEPVSLEVFEKMVGVCDNGLVGRRDRAMLYLLLDTGLRASELLALKLDDVDLLSGQCFVRKGKGRKPRTVFMGDKSRRVLRRYLKMRSDHCPALFVTDDGEGGLTYWGLKSKIKRLAQKAGVPTPSLHSFRYRYALSALRDGMDVFSLQESMGHKDLQVLRRYLKQNESDVEKAMKAHSPVDHMR